MSKAMWGGRFSKSTDEMINEFQASINFDKRMYHEDIRGSIAHARMLAKCGILTEEDRDRCKAALLETIVFGPYQTASSTSQHGSYTLTVGAQTITSQALETIKTELRRLYTKYSEDAKLEALNASGGEIKWVSETD